MQSPVHPLGETNAANHAPGDARANLLSLEAMAKRVQALDQKVLYVERREQEGWRVAAQQLNDLTEQSQGGTAAIANLEMRLSREVQRLEETVGRELAVEMQRRAEADTRAREAITHAATEVREAIAALEGNRFAVLDRKIDDMASTVSEMCGVFDKRLGELSSQVAHMSKAAATEVVRIEELIAARRKEHEANEVRVLLLLEETCTGLHEQLREERRLRDESHMRLEKLLVESAQKLWVRA